jgi:hypothetical protein
MTPTATKSELARALKIHRAQLDTFLAKPGAPSPDKKKKYDSKAVAAFIAESRGAGSLDTLREARLEEVRLRCERLRRELDRDAKLTVLRSDVDALHGRMAHGLRSLLYDCLENRMPAACAGYDSLQLRRFGRDLADELVGRLAKDVNSWVPA